MTNPFPLYALEMMAERLVGQAKWFNLPVPHQASVMHDIAVAASAALTAMIERGDAREAFSVEYFFTNSGEFSGIEANSDKNDLGNPDEAFPAIIIRTKEPNNDRP